MDYLNSMKFWLVAMKEQMNICMFSFCYFNLLVVKMCFSSFDCVYFEYDWHISFYDKLNLSLCYALMSLFNFFFCHQNYSQSLEHMCLCQSISLGVYSTAYLFFYSIWLLQALHQINKFTSHNTYIVGLNFIRLIQ